MIIGICGGTGSGKTTIANRILESVSADEVVFIQQDLYYRDLKDMPLDYRNAANYAKSLNFPINYTIGNPGADTYKGYIGTVRSMEIFEGSGLPSTSVQLPNLPNYQIPSTALLKPDPFFRNDRVSLEPCIVVFGIVKAVVGATAFQPGER